MSKKFDIIELEKYAFLVEEAKEVKIGKYTAFEVSRVIPKIEEMYIIFDKDDVKELTNDEIIELVKSSTKYKTNLDISNRKRDTDNYVSVKYNMISYHNHLDKLTKNFINRTKDMKIQRFFQFGKSHKDPKFYKYVWWVFHNELKSDNVQEMINSNESQFFDREKVDILIDELTQKNEPCILVEKSYPRLGVKVFDYDKMKKKNPDIEFAPALEDDESYTNM